MFAARIEDERTRAAFLALSVSAGIAGAG
jgi:hypothetical protein